LWWFATFFVFLSLAATKRQLYLLPAYPAVALLLGPWLASVGHGQPGMDASPGTRPVNIYSLVLAIAYLIIGIALIGVFAKYSSVVSGQDLNDLEAQVAINLRVPLALLGIVLLGSGLWIGHAWRHKDARASLVRIGGAQVALYVVILAFVMPAFGAIKTYAPQSRWISEAIGDETHFGMVDPNGIARRGGFAYYTGTMVDLLDSEPEVERFFKEHPDSVVLIVEESTDRIFAGNQAAWQSRILRELRVGSYLYVVVGGSRG
jgi:4-amino-4-deoxy-L-arabinose transferase-like glycosyltransferase